MSQPPTEHATSAGSGGSYIGGQHTYETVNQKISSIVLSSIWTTLTGSWEMAYGLFLR